MRKEMRKEGKEFLQMCRALGKNEDTGVAKRGPFRDSGNRRATPAPRLEDLDRGSRVLSLRQALPISEPLM